MKLVEFFVFVFCQCGFLPLDLGEVGFSAVCFLVGAVTSVIWWIFLLWQFLGGVIQSQHVVQALC